MFVLVGICIYLAGLALPQPSYVSLLGLLMSALAVFFGWPRRTLSWSPLTIAVFAFLASVGVSTLVSDDIGRSLRLSPALLPGVLLFVLVHEHLEGVKQIRLVYLTCSMVALVVAVVVLWAAARHGHGGAGVRAVISPALGPPILIVPNDLTFLAVIAPLSLVLFYQEPRRGGGIAAGVSIILSLVTICIFATRTAALTLVLGLIATTLLVERRFLVRNLVAGFALLCIALLANALFFPESQVITRLVRDWTLTGRTDFWATAWTMFQEAPLFGKGPHTFGIFNRTPWPHNLYVEVLAEQGLIGLATLGGMLVCGIVVAWDLRRSSIDDIRYFGVGALASVIAMCCAGVVELSLLREWVVTTLFILLGIIGHLASQEGSREHAGADDAAGEPHLIKVGRGITQPSPNREMKR